MKQLYILICIGLGSTLAFAQEGTVTPKKVEVKRINQFVPATYVPTLEPKWEHLEAPKPGGDSYKSFLMRQKVKARQEASSTGASKRSQHSDRVNAELNPQIVREFGMTRFLAGPNVPPDLRISPQTGGTPLDNTMAISNGGLLLGSVNSLLWGYDTQADDYLFKEQDGSSRVISFAAFAGDSLIPNPNQTFPFDPKLLYDPLNDRFIFVYLDGRGPTDSQCIVGFSSTNDPRDPWNVYSIPGNPRGEPQWTDYPAIGISGEDLFLTVNLIQQNVSWQEGFRGTLIWQMSLADGYAGAVNLGTQLWDDIRYNGRYIRNLNPVEGAYGNAGNNVYFISNRNFDIQNDSVFLVEVTNTLSSGQAQLNISVHKTDVPYGVPPNGRQEDTPQGEQDSLGLQTNDARWLGAILINDRIHMVGNSRNFETGLASVYHGILDGVSTDNPTLTGHIIGSDSLDYGYPKIAFTGGQDCEEWLMIGFDHTSPTVFPGVSTIFYDHENEEYSEVIRLKEGENYVRKIASPYERWGDYFGIQRKYDQPGIIWTSGFYGIENRNSSTWFSELRIADSLCAAGCISLNVDTIIGQRLNECEVELTAQASGPYEPFTYLWNGQSVDSSTVVNICNGLYTLEVTDARQCKVNMSGKWEAEVPASNVYPNPIQERFTVSVELSRDREVEAYLININGQERIPLSKTQALNGQNQFSFSAAALAQGVYVFILTSEGETLVEETIVKYE